ncbi:pentapeptide repeat-containing protein [Streptosporangium sp. NPDC023825]|uniref:pentapeptide repeat-containing protein n=1 Tax=Streptosporangium sp. NPDC023825 TaxID=3154909 RepID=UPI0034461A27
MRGRRHSRSRCTTHSYDPLNAWLDQRDAPWKARLTGAGLSWTTPTRADLTDATLTHANMRFARLRSPEVCTPAACRPLRASVQTTSEPIGRIPKGGLRGGSVRKLAVELTTCGASETRPTIDRVPPGYDGRHGML